MISVCIPTFEQYGAGVKNLTTLLNSLVPQKGIFEVVISDNSKDDKILNLLKLYESRLDIRYYHNKILGVSPNTNNAISKARYDKIKPMYMDDTLVTIDALQTFSKHLDKHNWVISWSTVINETGRAIGLKNANWSDHIMQGKNTIGMPSVMAYKGKDILFDPTLHTMLDCEFYYRLYQKYGDPGVIKDRIVTQRYHDNSSSRKMPNTKDKEIEILNLKYNL
jgi:hypothetical protein